MGRRAGLFEKMGLFGTFGTFHIWEAPAGVTEKARKWGGSYPKLSQKRAILTQFCPS